MPKLSIIVPVYNVELFLERSMKNLINQTLKDIEIILINDGSNDDSLNICKKYADLDNRILLIDKQNEGVSVARNVGIKASKSEYIAFMDPDDEIELNMYENMYRYITEYKCDICLCNYIKVVKDNKYIINIPYKQGLYQKGNIEDLMIKMIGGKELEENTIMGSVWRSIYKKNIIMNNKIEFPINIRPMQDLIFMLKYLSFCENMFLDKNPYYKYYIRDNSGVTGYKRNNWENNKEVYNLLKKLLHDNGILEENEIRLRNRFINSAIMAIVNEVHVDNKIDFNQKLHNINSIISDEELQMNINSLSIYKEGVNLRKKIILLLMKQKIYFILYIYYYLIRKINYK